MPRTEQMIECTRTHTRARIACDHDDCDIAKTFVIDLRTERRDGVVGMCVAGRYENTVRAKLSADKKYNETRRAGRNVVRTRAHQPFV